MKKLLHLFEVVLSLVLLLTLVGCMQGFNPEIETLKSKEDVEKAIGNNYQITVKYFGGNGQENSTFTVKKDGDSMIYTTSDNSETNDTILVNENKVYEYNEEDDMYTYVSSLSNEDVSNFNYGLVAAFSISELGEVMYTSKESTTFLGRACTKYEYVVGVNIISANYNSTSTYIFDNETGFCFFFNVTVDAAAIGQGQETESGSFEVTEFKLGQVNLDSEIAKIDKESEGDNNGGNTNIAEGYDKYVNQGAVILFPTDTYQKSMFGGIERIEGVYPYIRISISSDTFASRESNLQSEYESKSDYSLTHINVGEHDAFKCVYSDSLEYHMEVVIDGAFINDEFWSSIIIKVDMPKSNFELSMFDDEILWNIINSFYFDGKLKYSY